MDSRPLRIILSRRGELLTFDRAAGGVRFGALATSAANVGLARDSNSVVAPTSSTITCVPHAQPPFATLSGLDTDQTVLLADARLLSTLRDLATATWVRQQPSRAIGGSAFLRGLAWPSDFVAAIGDVSIDLAASLDLLQSPADPDALFVIDPDARIERLMRYDPMVAYTAFGPNMSLFRCLESSLYSLSRVAQFPGRVLILSDRGQADLEFLVPGELRHRTRFERMAASDVMAMALARYRLPRLAAAQLARPLLYVDTDVIFDRPIEPLLVEVLQARRLCVFAEDHLHNKGDFYGAKLFAADPGFAPANERGFSTGVIGIPDVAAAAEPFDALLALAMAQCARHGTSGLPAFDQRFANYLFHKLIDYDDTVINRHETYCNGRDPDPARRLGLAHFAGGLGNATPKLARMSAYLATLLQTDPAPR